MNQQTSQADWMQDESVKQIDRAKLEFLQNCYSVMQGKEKKQLMFVLSNLIREAKQKGLQFTPEEMNIAVAAIKKHGTEESNKQIDQILSGKVTPQNLK